MKSRGILIATVLVCLASGMASAQQPDTSTQARAPVPSKPETTPPLPDAQAAYWRAREAGRSLYDARRAAEAPQQAAARDQESNPLPPPGTPARIEAQYRGFKEWRALPYDERKKYEVDLPKDQRQAFERRWQTEHRAIVMDRAIERAIGGGLTGLTILFVIWIIRAAPRWAGPICQAGTRLRTRVSTKPLLATAIVATLLALWLFRFELSVPASSGSPITYRLDRWTGHVAFCTPSGCETNSGK